MNTTCKCSKCGDMLDIEYRVLDSTIIVEPRSDIQVFILHKPIALNGHGVCGGIIALNEKRAYRIAQERTLPLIPEDTGLYTLEQRIVSLKRDNHTLDEICKLCDCSMKQVKSALNGKTKKVRRKYEQILQYQYQALSVAEIAAKLSVSRTRIYQILKKYGNASDQDACR